MTLRSGGVTRTTCAATAGVRPCVSTARLDAQSLSARRTSRGISSTRPPAPVIALASLLVAPRRPATVSTSRVEAGTWATADASPSALVAGMARTNTTRWGSRNGAWRMASWRRAGASPVPSRVSRPKSETSSLPQSASVARALSSTRKRSSPWSSSAVTPGCLRCVALVPARGARGISRSYLQRQGDRALLVGAQDVGRKTRRHASGPTRRDELRGGGDRGSLEVRRQPASAAAGQQHVAARTAQARGGNRLGVDVEVAEVAERPAVGSDHTQRDIRGAGLVAGRAAFGRDHLQLEAGDHEASAGEHRLDGCASSRLLE